MQGCVHGQVTEGRVDVQDPRVGNDMSFVNHVTNFVAITKKYRVSQGVELTI